MLELLRFLILFLSGLWVLVIFAGAVSALFMSNDALRKLYATTDTWSLRPLNNIVAWVVDARQFRSRDG